MPTPEERTKIINAAPHELLAQLVEGFKHFPSGLRSYDTRAAHYRLEAQILAKQTALDLLVMPGMTARAARKRSRAGDLSAEMRSEIAELLEQSATIYSNMYPADQLALHHYHGTGEEIVERNSFMTAIQEWSNAVAATGVTAEQEKSMVLDEHDLAWFRCLNVLEAYYATDDDEHDVQDDWNERSQRWYVSELLTVFAERGRSAFAALSAPRPPSSAPVFGPDLKFPDAPESDR